MGRPISRSDTYGRASSRKLTFAGELKDSHANTFQGATPLQAIGLLQTWVRNLRRNSQRRGTKEEEIYETVNVQRLERAVTIVIAALALSSSVHAEGEAKTDVPRYAGALTFAPDGTCNRLSSRTE